MSRCSGLRGERKTCYPDGNGGQTTSHRNRDARPMPRVVVAYTTGYVVYYLSNALFLLAAIPFLLLLAPFPDTKRTLFLRMGHVYTYLLTHIILPRLDVCHVIEVSGMNKLEGRGPFVFVSNHRGRLDALLVVGLTTNTSVVVKARHARFPLLAFLVRHAGFVSVDQGSPASIAGALRKCGELLAGGTNLLVFPEGSRSAGARVRRFGNLAFRVAVAHGATIVPVVIYSRTAFMCKSLDTFYPRNPVHYRIRFLDPLQPLAQETTATLSDRVYRIMASELKTLEREAQQREAEAVLCRRN